MPSKVKSSPEVPSKSGKLHAKHSDSESSDDEIPVRPSKQNSKANLSDSEEETVPRKRISSPVKTKSSKKASSSDDELDMSTIPAPPSKKKTAEAKAKSTKAKAPAKKPESPSSGKKRKASTPVKKTSKPSKKQVEESDSDSSSDDDSALATPEKLRIARSEMLSEEEMKQITREDNDRRYKQCTQYIKWYNKEYKVQKDLPAWQVASKLLTDAGATLTKYRGLINTKTAIKPESHLNQAIPALKVKGESQYAEAMKMVEALSDADRTLFWEEQARNKDAKSFEELVTKKDYAKAQLREEIREEIRAEMGADEDA